MNDMNDDLEQQDLSRDCAEARATLHDLMDGPVETDRRVALDAHLAGCEACREVRDGLEAVRTGLRSLPMKPFPDDALSEVWSRTVHASPVESPATWWQPRLGAAAALAASLVAVTLLVVWSGGRPTAEPPASVAVVEPGRDVELSPEEIEQVRAEARQVLELTAAALSRTQVVGFERIIEDKISPAIRKIRIQWPGAEPPDDRRSKT